MKSLQIEFLFIILIIARAKKTGKEVSERTLLFCQKQNQPILFYGSHLTSPTLLVTIGEFGSFIVKFPAFGSTNKFSALIPNAVP